MDNIISRLRRNAQKQKEYRHIVRGRKPGVSYATSKRIADIFFLHKYAGVGFAALGRLYSVSRTRAQQISSKDHCFEFKVCHPKKSCM
jgi:hypothetical protein